jgi:hypothetical protein
MATPQTSAISNGAGTNKGLMITLALASIFIAFFTGVLAAFGNPVLLIPFLVMVVGLGLIAQPRIAVWVVIIAGTIISGLIELYLPSLQLLRWGVALLSMALIVMSLVVMAFSSHAAEQKKLDPAAVGVLAAAVGLVICALFTVLANPSSIGTSLVGLKNYFQMFGLLIALAAFRYTPGEASRFMRFILVLGLIQLPFAIHQFIHFVPLRSGLEAATRGIVAVDVVAGTFGGSRFGGGRSSTLALLASIAIVLVLAQWRAGQRTLTSTALYSLAFAMPMALNEAKLFILLLPVGLFLLFRDRIFKNPVKAMASGVLVVGLMASLLVGYSMLPGAKSQHIASLDTYLEENLAYNIGNRGYGNALLNRNTVYSFWWKENIAGGDYLKAVLGHGPGVTNSSSLVARDTLANTRYLGYGIGLTSVSALLWEIGLLGTAAVFLLIFMAYRLGEKLQRRWLGTGHWPFIKAAQLAMPLIAISMFHNDYFVSDMSFQALVLLFIGYLVAMSRHTPERRS